PSGTEPRKNCEHPGDQPRVGRTTFHCSTEGLIFGSQPWTPPKNRLAFVQSWMSYRREDCAARNGMWTVPFCSTPQYDPMYMCSWRGSQSGASLLATLSGGIVRVPPLIALKSL